MSQDSEADRYVPFREWAEPEAAVHVKLPDDATAASWWIVTSPMWLPVPTFFLWLFSIASPLAGAVLTAYIASWPVALALFASWDARTLRRRGYWSTASPLWVLLTPLAYLLARRRSVRSFTPDGGIVVLVTHIVLFVGFCIYVLMAIGVGGLKPPVAG